MAKKRCPNCRHPAHEGVCGKFKWAVFFLYGMKRRWCKCGEDMYKGILDALEDDSLFEELKRDGE